MASSPLLLLVLLASSAVVLAAAGVGGGDGEPRHIRLYMHEIVAGTNATGVAVVSSPLGANSEFGSVYVLDNILRAGRDPNSELVGRYQGIMVGTGQKTKSYLSLVTFVFTAGEYRGSTLTMDGPVLSFTGTIERSLVGGTGAFRLAHGYCLVKLVGQLTPDSDVYQIDLFVLMHELTGITI